MDIIDATKFELESRQIMCLTDFLKMLYELAMKGNGPKDDIYFDLHEQYERFSQVRGWPAYTSNKLTKILKDWGIERQMFYFPETKEKKWGKVIPQELLKNMIITFENTFATSGLAILKINGEQYAMVINVRPIKQTPKPKVAPKAEAGEGEESAELNS